VKTADSICPAQPTTGGVGHVLIAVSVNPYMNIYEITHRAACPNGKLIDTYQIKIASHNTIIVEDLIELLKDAPKQIYQEDLADYLRAKLGAKVEVIGWHYGIKITCTRE
jgi:hypothetical protein